LLRLGRPAAGGAFDTEALSASFPFAAADPPPGVSSLHRASREAAHRCCSTLRRARTTTRPSCSGAGKSYLAKLEALRLLFGGGGCS
jgi:hypothetical protein